MGHSEQMSRSRSLGCRTVTLLLIPAQQQHRQKKISSERACGVCLCRNGGAPCVVCCLVWCVVGSCIHLLAIRYQPAYLDQDLKNGKRYEGLGRRAGSYMKCGVDPAVVGRC